MNDNRESLAAEAVVLDPEPLCHEGMRSILHGIGIGVVGAARWPGEALALVQERRPDLLVAELETPSGVTEGLRCLRQARDHDATLKILVLSANGDPRRVRAALTAGANGYILKSADPEHITAEIERALAPSRFVSPRRGGRGGRRAALAVAPDDQGLPGLTRRELEVLRLLDGRSNREVAKLLWVTDETVKFHLANIYRKLGVSNRADAVAAGKKNRLLDGLVHAGDGRAGMRVPLLGASGER